MKVYDEDIWQVIGRRQACVRDFQCPIHELRQVPGSKLLTKPRCAYAGSINLMRGARRTSNRDVKIDFEAAEAPEASEAEEDDRGDEAAEEDVEEEEDAEGDGDGDGDEEIPSGQVCHMMLNDENYAGVITLNHKTTDLLMCGTPQARMP